MKFVKPERCDCGGDYIFEATGSSHFSDAICEKCGSSALMLDPLSVSIPAERLLVRSEQELSRGDYTLAILLAAIAVETFLSGFC